MKVKCDHDQPAERIGGRSALVLALRARERVSHWPRLSTCSAGQRALAVLAGYVFCRIGRTQEPQALWARDIA